MALTPASKGLIVAALVGGIGYLVYTHKAGIVENGSKLVADSTSVRVDSTNKSDSSHVLPTNVEAKVETLTTTSKVEAPIKEAKQVERKKETAAPVKHKAKKQAVSEKTPAASNNVIPNF